MARFEVSNDRLGMLHGMTMPEPQATATSSSGSGLRRKRDYEASPPRMKAPDTTSSGSYGDPLPPPSSGRRPRHLSSRFRFKKKPRKSTSTSTSHGASTSYDSPDRYRYRSHKRRKPSYTAPLTDDPTAYDDSYIPNSAAWTRAVDPDAAFRESLFDAMADDEGAAFWEGVYGQPIHGYERPEKTDEHGELERMGDEEYAKYVRERMWEKSHQHIMEERRRIEEEREGRKRREREEREQWEQEERDRRREEHRERRREQGRREDMRAGRRWTEYTYLWEAQGEHPDASAVPWPTLSGLAEDISRETVEAFLRAAALGDMAEVLKIERVRWHPDKALQRWGRDALGEETLKRITTVFQAVDGIWSDMKEKRRVD